MPNDRFERFVRGKKQGCTGRRSCRGGPNAIVNALKAARLVLLTDVDGVLNKGGELISSIGAGKIKKMIDELPDDFRSDLT